MQRDDQLRSIQRNRAKTSRLRTAGSLVKDLAEHVYKSGVGPAEEVARRLALLVDGGFREHCRVAEVRGGRLLIHVDTAELVYPLSKRWQETLREALPTLCAGRRITRVVFEYGTAGQRPAVSAATRE